MTRWRRVLTAAVLAGLAPLGLVPAALAGPRPQLSAQQAEAYRMDRVLAVAGTVHSPVHDPWHPLDELQDEARRGAAPGTPQAPRLQAPLRVDPAAADGRHVFATVQQAIDHVRREALQGGGGAVGGRVEIAVAPGEHEGLVDVPPLPVALTLRGEGAEPSAVRLHAAPHAGMSGAAYARRYTLPEHAPHRACAARETLGTGCSAVLWVRNTGFRLVNLTVENRHDESTPGAGGHQAVAVATEADRVHLERVALRGNQDTLYLRAPAHGTLARVFVHASHVEGDVDFVFGNAVAYFLGSRLHWVGARRGLARGWVAAPSTHVLAPYGFVFEGCEFSAEPVPVPAAAVSATRPAPRVHLARQWFAGARCSPYGDHGARCAIEGDTAASPVPDGTATLERRSLESVGQMVVLRSQLGAHLDAGEPWAPWQSDRSHPAYRPAQVDSADFHRRLHEAGRAATARRYPAGDPPRPFLAEHCNRGAAAPGAEAATPQCPR